MSDIVFWHLVYLGAAVVFLTLALLLGVALGVPHARDLFRGWDDLGAALGGGDGRHSVSAYCGRCHARKAYWLYGVVLYAAINLVLGASHCDNAYRLEFPEDFEKE